MSANERGLGRGLDALREAIRELPVTITTVSYTHLTLADD